MGQPTLASASQVSIGLLLGGEGTENRQWIPGGVKNGALIHFAGECHLRNRNERVLPGPNSFT